MNVLSPILVERTYKSSIQKVWKIITTQEYLTQWLMPGNFKAEVGYQYEFKCDPPESMEDWDGKVYGEVLSIDEPYSITFTWNNTRLSKGTTVTFNLEETDKGVLFSVSHEGFAEQDLAEYEPHVSGWDHHLSQIEKM